MSKSVDIVGAGIAGLSVGCYLQMNGYRTQIFERHELPGGLCTSWKRAGYTFDNCVQWLLGSAPGVRLHDAWQELGALPGPRIVDHEEFLRVVGADGATLVLYTNVDRLERHLHELAPEDGRPIRELTNLIRRQVGFDFPLGKPRELMTPLDRLKVAVLMLPSTWSFVRYGRVSLREFASRFRSPFLREALTKLFDLPDFPLFGLTMPLAWMHKHVAGYPVGGSLEFIQGVEQRYCDLGGRIHFRAPVTEILVEPSDRGRSRAAGVRLADGSEDRADYVISAADGHSTLYGMLHGKFMDEQLRAVYDKGQVFPPIVRVSFGMACDLSTEPHDVVQILHTPLPLGGVDVETVEIRHYGYDPTMAEPRKSSVAVLLKADYDFWDALAGNPEAYASEKQRILAAVTDVVLARFPKAKGRIEVVDVATPLTFQRYTGNWRGSTEGILIRTGNLTRQISKTLPGLDDFYQVGQWVQPGGGLPSGVMTGREVAQSICARDRHTFRTTKAARARSAV